MQPSGAAEEFRQYATYARNFGTPLYLVGCGPNGNDARWTRGFMERSARRPMRATRCTITRTAASRRRSSHPRPCTRNPTFPPVEAAIIQQRAILDRYDPAPADRADPRRVGRVGPDVPDEEQRNGRLWQQATMRSAVAAGLGLNIFNRQADKLYMCNIAQMVNVLQSLMLTDGPEGKNCVRTSNYWAFMLFKPHRSKKAVKVEYDGYHLQTAPAGRGGGDVAASRRRLRRRTFRCRRPARERNGLSLVNPRHDTDMDCGVHAAR